MSLLYQWDWWQYKDVMRLPSTKYTCYENTRLLVIVIGYCHCIWYVLLFPAFWIIIGLVKRSCSPWCMVKWGCNSLIMIMEICLRGAITTSSICDEAICVGGCKVCIVFLVLVIVLVMSIYYWYWLYYLIRCCFISNNDRPHRCWGICVLLTVT